MTKGQSSAKNLIITEKQTEKSMLPTHEAEHVSKVLKRALAIAAISASLAGCGGGRPSTDSYAAPATRHAPTAALVFGDIDPHDWSGTTPKHHQVHGIDVSRWQGDIDWRQVRSSGISFAYIKATEGGDFTDPMFRKNWELAGSAGVPRGAYHFYYFCRGAVEQARWFIDNVPRDRNALPHVLDMEWNHQSKTCKHKPDGESVRREAAKFLDMLERHYGKRPLVYTTPDFYKQTGIGRIPRTEFWLRSVAGHPSQTYPGASWTFWQYTGTGVVPGVRGPVDINAFAGTGASWASWYAARVAVN